MPRRALHLWPISPGILPFSNLDATGSRFRISGTHFGKLSPGRPAVRGFLFPERSKCSQFKGLHTFPVCSAPQIDRRRDPGLHTGSPPPPGGRKSQESEDLPTSPTKKNPARRGLRGASSHKWEESAARDSVARSRATITPHYFQVRQRKESARSACQSPTNWRR
jgi:hypothetical protein